MVRILPLECWSRKVFHWHLAILAYKVINGMDLPKNPGPTLGVGERREEWAIMGTKEEQKSGMKVTLYY